MAFRPIQHNGRCVYSVKTGSPIPQVRAQEMGEYIADLENDIEITPHNLVDQAKRKRSKLHEFFEWDDKIAGYKWRVQEARTIINHFQVAVVDFRTEEETTVRAWHSVVTVDPVKEFEAASGDNGHGEELDPDKNRAYVNVLTVMADDDYRTQVINNALREADAWRKRYSTYDELEPVFTAIELVSQNGH